MVDTVAWIHRISILTERTMNVVVPDLCFDYLCLLKEPSSLVNNWNSSGLFLVLYFHYYHVLYVVELDPFHIQYRACWSGSWSDTGSDQFYIKTVQVLKLHTLQWSSSLLKAIPSPCWPYREWRIICTVLYTVYKYSGWQISNTHSWHSRLLGENIWQLLAWTNAVLYCLPVSHKRQNQDDNKKPINCSIKHL